MAIKSKTAKVPPEYTFRHPCILEHPNGGDVWLTTTSGRNAVCLSSPGNRYIVGYVQCDIEIADMHPYQGTVELSNDS